MNQFKDNDGVSGQDPFLRHFIPGTSEWACEARATIARLNAPRNRSLVRMILIRGESGAGKGHLASVIAGHSRWLEIRGSDADLGLNAGLGHYNDKFADISIPGLPEHLISSELFGHKKGAFTGAGSDHLGYFAQNLNDILLDEIGDADLPLQAKLLGVLQTGRFLPLGGAKDDERRVKPRIMFATNRDLAGLAATEKFRSDLLWRINMFAVEVPPLRFQAENMDSIIDVLERELDSDLDQLEGESDSFGRLPSKDRKWAATYAWPGNVRQLAHALRRWRFYDGADSLESIARKLESEVERSDVTACPVEDFVFQHLRDIQNGNKGPLASPGEFIRSLGNSGRRAVVRWAHGIQGNREVLKRVFSSESPRSVQNQISKWRNEDRGKEND